jgi:hypothetical protein
LYLLNELNFLNSSAFLFFVTPGLQNISGWIHTAIKKQLKSLRRGNKDCEGLWKYTKEKGIGGKTRGDWSVERGEEVKLGGKLSRELTRVKGLGSRHPKLLGCDASYCGHGC